MSKHRLTQIITDYFNDKYKSTTYKMGYSVNVPLSHKSREKFYLT